MNDVEHISALWIAETRENERLRELILDACIAFEHYDLPEHALHYRRMLKQETPALPSTESR